MNIIFLNEENKKLKSELSVFKKDINSDDFKNNLIKNYFWEKMNELINLYNYDEWKFFLVIIYLFSSLFLYLFFIIYTIPLRIIRFIWRKISWYKEFNSENYINLSKKYNFLKVEKQKNSSEKRNLINQMSDLKFINKKLKTENFNFKNNIKKSKNDEVIKKIRENKEKEKSVKNNSLSTEGFYPQGAPRSPLKKEIIQKKKIEKKSFNIKEKTDLFWKKKGWWLFD